MLQKNWKCSQEDKNAFKSVPYVNRNALEKTKMISREKNVVGKIEILLSQQKLYYKTISILIKTKILLKSQK